ncbi:MAG: hypothetical protein QN163_10685 [Armatimonadota bacterium]|nr:hypothetical protein [Armatimonadota bacterium]MDR5697876.1 hypothetical protein [Armatimonadota bacterium]
MTNSAASDGPVCRGIEILARLTAELDAAGVDYCHWKSNAFVKEVAWGEGDLDLLVPAQSATAFSGVATKLGFKSFVASPCRAYPGIVDHLGFDQTTGVLVHLHVYHRLVTGETHLKGYELPWDSLMLSTRRRDPNSGLYVLDPDLEMVVFLVREALKLRTRDRLRHLRTPYWRGRRLAEYEWLRERARPEGVEDMGLRVLPPRVAQTLRGMSERMPSVAEVARLRRAVAAALAVHRRYGPLGAIWQAWMREICWAWGGLDRRLLRRPVPHTRVPASGGALVAFVGSDGSGKSAVVRTVEKWLSRKAAVYTVYFGSGEGPASLLRWPLRMALRVLRSDRRTATPAREGGGESERGWQVIARAVWALVLAYEKRGKLRRAWQAKDRGMVVLCDRYPQNRVPGHMDGPLLSRWTEHRWRFLRFLARWERIPYDRAATRPPDAVIHLVVSPEVASGRKPGMDPADIVRRTNSAHVVAHAAGAQVFTVDADAGLDEVVAEVKRAVWSVI